MRVLEINKELYFVLDWSEKNSNNQKNICDEDPNNGKVRYLNGKKSISLPNGSDFEWCANLE